MADKTKYLDYDGTAVLKNKILEKFDDKISDIDDTLANTVKSYKTRDLILNYANNVNDYLSGENLSSDIVTINTNDDDVNILSATFPTDRTDFVCQCECFIVDVSTDDMFPVFHFETVTQDNIIQNDDGTYTINVDCSDIAFGTNLTAIKEMCTQMGMDTDDTTLVQSSLIGMNITLINLDENLKPVNNSNVINGYNNNINNTTTSTISGVNNNINNTTTSTISGVNNDINNTTTSTILGSENNINNINSSLVAGKRNVVHGQGFIPTSEFAKLSCDVVTNIVTLQLLTEKLANPFQVGDFVYHCSWYGIHPSKVLTVSTEDVYTTITFNFNNALDETDALTWHANHDHNFYGILNNSTKLINSSNVLGNYNGMAGSSSFASGFGNCCPTDYNFALGRHCASLGQHSFSTGWGNVSVADNSFSCGSFCTYDEKAAFQVGNGIGGYDRSDLLNLSQDGLLKVADYAIGDDVPSLKAKIADLEARLSALENA